MKRGLAWALCAGAAFATVFSFTANSWGLAFRAQSHAWLFVLAPLAVWYRRQAALRGRLLRFSLAGGALFGTCMAVGSVIGMNNRAADVFLLWPGYFFFYTALCGWLLRRLPEEGPPRPQGAFKAGLAWLLCGEKKQTLLVWGLLALFWAVFYFLFFPGLVSVDTIDSMRMGLGFAPLSAGHPPLLAAWLAACMRVGRALFGSLAAGVALAAGMQLLALGALVAWVLRHMACRGFALWCRAAAFFLYLLSPVYGWYAVTLWKDVWLAAFILLWMVLLGDIAQQRAKFFRRPQHLFLLIVAVAGILLAKNNGVYLLAGALAAGVAALRGCRRELAALLCAGLIFWGAVEGPVYSALGIAKGSPAEALSIPMLQVAYVVKQAGHTLSQNDRALVGAVLPVDELAERYNPLVSDSIKSQFNLTAFRAAPEAYLAVWVRLGLRYPSLYVRAFLEHCYAYFYPDAGLGEMALTPYTAYVREHREDVAAWEPYAGRYAEPARGFVSWVREGIGTERNMPGVNVLFSVGFAFWVLLFLCLALLYRRQRARLLPFAMQAVLWLTCIASPVNGSFRYGFGAVLALPFLLGWALGQRGGACPRAEDAVVLAGR